MVGVDAGGVDGYRYRAVLRVFRVVGELAIEVVEAAVQPAVTQMRNLEGDELVRTLGIKRVGAAVIIRLSGSGNRSEEHTSELQSRPHLVCRLLLEKKKS